MKKPTLIATCSALVALAAADAMAYDVSIEGKPTVRNQLMPSVEWSGGSMQLTARVKVLDDEGKPAKGVRVRLSAKSGAGLARLREIGLTNAEGEAIVVTAFDVPVLSLAKVELAACVEPASDCSVTNTYDLRRRLDLEIENTYSENAGTQTFSSASARGGSDMILSTGNQCEAVGRVVMNLFSNGSVTHTNTWSLYLEGGGYFLHSNAYGQGVAYFGNGLGTYVLKSVTSTGMHPSAEAGLQGEAWGRLFVQGSFSPPLSGNPALVHAQAAWEQPVGRSVSFVGGYAIDLPEFGNSENQYGPSRGPLFGIALSRARAATWSILLLGSWESEGRFQFQSTNGTTTVWTIPATVSPSVQLSWDYHRGGPLYLSFYISGQQLNTPSKTFSFGTTVTLKDFLRRTAK